MSAQMTTVPSSWPVISSQLLFGDRRLARSISSSASNPSPPDFLPWLLKARTELGTFPDWPYVREFAAQLTSGRDIIVLKRRQALFSWIMAAYTHWTAAYHPYRHCSVGSAGEREAKAQARRILTVARHDGFELGDGTQLLVYPNGSTVTIYPATAHAGIGQSLALAHLDEFALHPYGTENLAALRPAVASSGGQIVITSTSHPRLGRSGPLWEAWSGNSLAERLFYGRWIRPDQQRDAEVWERELAGMTADAFHAYYPEVEEEAFTSSAGLVFGRDAFGQLIFDPNENVCEPEFPLKACPVRILGWDPGGEGDPAGFWLMGLYPRPATSLHKLGLQVKGDYRRHVYEAWRETGGGVSSRRCAEWAKYFHATHVFVAETGGDGLKSGVEDYGVRAWKALQPRADKIPQLQDVLLHRAMTISPGLTELEDEFQTTWWEDIKDNATKQAWAWNTPRTRHHADIIHAGMAAESGYLSMRPAAPQGQVQRVGSVAMERAGYRNGRVA